MTNDIFSFYFQNRLIQTSQTGGQWYSDAPPFSIPWFKGSIPASRWHKKKKKLKKGKNIFFCSAMSVSGERYQLTPDFLDKQSAGGDASWPYNLEGLQFITSLDVNVFW
jgi:hypothetical protein